MGEDTYATPTDPLARACVLIWPSHLTGSYVYIQQPDAPANLSLDLSI